MIKAIKSGIRHTFTCGEWENLAPGHGWAELENTCGSVLDSYHRPFAASDYVAQAGTIGKRPTVKVVDASSFTAGVLDLSTIGLTVDFDYADLFSVYENGQLLNLTRNYLVDVPNNELQILGGTSFSTFTVIYFQ